MFLLKLRGRRLTIQTVCRRSGDCKTEDKQDPITTHVQREEPSHKGGRVSLKTLGQIAFVDEPPNLHDFSLRHCYSFHGKDESYYCQN
jgi:hypothetical protein